MGTETWQVANAYYAATSINSLLHSLMPKFTYIHICICMISCVHIKYVGSCTKLHIFRCVAWVMTSSKLHRQKQARNSNISAGLPYIACHQTVQHSMKHVHTSQACRKSWSSEQPLQKRRTKQQLTWNTQANLETPRTLLELIT